MSKTQDQLRWLSDNAPRLWWQPEDPKAPSNDERSHSRPAQIEVREVADSALAFIDALTPLLDIGQDEDGSWHASVRAMPGHVGAADTLEQAVIEAAEAAELWVAVVRDQEPEDDVDGSDRTVTSMP